MSRIFQRIIATVVLLSASFFTCSVASAATPSEPSTGAALTSQMTQLFGAITSNSLSEASPLFFPESAYVKMKTGRIASPSTDYVNRLYAFYRLDLGSYHQAVSTNARFVGIRLTGTTAGWIPSGVCENSFGYWNLPNVRINFSENGIQESVLVASLISYAGKWYIIHLGPNPRPRNVGMVDSESSGAAPAGPPGGC